MNWFTSDSHFGHANIIKYCDRPFADAQEMEREMVRRWNARVMPDDTVFHLGDFAFGPKERAARILMELHGRVVLVRGNHDGSVTRCREVGFAEVHDSLFFESDKGRILLRHAPLDGPSGLGEVAQFCGHVHTSWARRDVGVPQVNVGADVRDFEPKTIEELL